MHVLKQPEVPQNTGIADCNCISKLSGLASADPSVGLYNTAYVKEGSTVRKEREGKRGDYEGTPEP